MSQDHRSSGGRFPAHCPSVFPAPSWGHSQAFPAPSLGTEGCSAVLLDADRSRPVLIAINGVLGVLWDPGFTLKRSSAAPGETLRGFQPLVPGQAPSACPAPLLLFWSRHKGSFRHLLRNLISDFENSSP